MKIVECRNCKAEIEIDEKVTKFPQFTWCSDCYGLAVQKIVDNHLTRKANEWMENNPEKVKKFYDLVDEMFPLLTEEEYQERMVEKKRAYNEYYRKNNPEVIKRKSKRYYESDKGIECYARNGVIRKELNKKALIPLTDEKVLEKRKIHRIKNIVNRLGLIDKMSIDHILPINSKEICGVETPDNLQLLPLKVNMSKKNKIVHQEQWDREGWEYMNPNHISEGMLLELFGVVKHYIRNNLGEK